MKYALEICTDKVDSTGADSTDTPKVPSLPEPQHSTLRKCYLRRSRRPRPSESTISTRAGTSDNPEVLPLPEPEVSVDPEVLPPPKSGISMFRKFFFRMKNYFGLK